MEENKKMDRNEREEMKRTIVCLSCGEMFRLFCNYEAHCEDEHEGNMILKIIYEGYKTFQPQGVVV